MRKSVVLITALLVAACCLPAFGQSGAITLNHVTGALGTDSIPTGSPITFFLRMNNNSSADIGGASNGFRIYSNDGAAWDTTTAFSTGVLEPHFDLGIFINEFSTDGVAADTIGLAGVSLWGSLVPGFNEVAWGISIGPIDQSMAGRSICLDSCFYPPANIWKWVAIGGGDYLPSWDGPHCFTIVEDVVSDPVAAVSLDHVDGLSGQDSIATNTPVSFHLRFTNNTGGSINGSTNGFRIYSPDGAQWGTTVADTTGALTSGMYDGGIFINDASITGSGADTVGLGGFSIFGTGIPDGYSEVPLTITIGPIDSSHIGQTICVDSSFYLPTGQWLWSDEQSQAVYPDWDGPHCFTIAYGEPPVDNASVSLDHTDGLVGPDTIGTGENVMFNLRLTNQTGIALHGLTNGFKVYSPDGANWGTTVGDTTSVFQGTDYLDGGIFVSHFSADGLGADTVGFGGFRLFGSGIPGNFSEVAFTIALGPIDHASDGKTICVDSTFFPPGGFWLWSMENIGGIEPDWDGPHCFAVRQTESSGAVDSLIVESGSALPCQAVQAIQTKLTQPIKGASIPIKIPFGVEVDSLSFEGLVTDDWEFAVKVIQPDSGFIFVALANSHGETIGPGLTTVFNIHYRSPAACQISHYMSWDTALAGDPGRSLLFSDAGNLDLAAGFDYYRDSTNVAGYLPADFDGAGDVHVGDLNGLGDYLFLGGPPPCNLNAMDLNGSCTGPNVADLTWLVDYLFQGGAAPVCGCLHGDTMPPPKLSPGAIVYTTYEGGLTTVYSDVSFDLKGIELTLEGPSDLQAANLLGGKFEMLAGSDGTQARIGLLDLQGEAVIESGNRALVRLKGKYHVKSAILSDMSHVDISATVEGVARLTRPDQFALAQNYPNPFNPTTGISFSLPEDAQVRVEVFNVMGQRVAVVADARYEAGVHTVEWHGQNSAGQSVASGIYLYRLTADDFVETKKMMLLK